MDIEKLFMLYVMNAEDMLREAVKFFDSQRGRAANIEEEQN